MLPDVPGVRQASLFPLSCTDEEKTIEFPPNGLCVSPFACTTTGLSSGIPSRLRSELSCATGGSSVSLDLCHSRIFTTVRVCFFPIVSISSEYRFDVTTSLVTLKTSRLRLQSKREVV